MLKYIVAGALIVGSAAPALAADYYVALRYGGSCVIMTTQPSSKYYKLMGAYNTKRQANMAMHGMMECR